MRPGVTLLWALRSPCNLNCRYCYFGTIEEDRGRATPLRPGQLSHLSRDDLTLEEMAPFLGSCNGRIVRRVFLAGGEPLMWHGTFEVIQRLKATGCEVVVCTNGIPLRDPHLCDRLLELGVEAVSVSLDSFDPSYNDRWRAHRMGRGWHDVVEGIETLLSQRRASSYLKVGIYSVLTCHNIAAILPTAEFVSRLGCDYYIVQPVSLAPDHALSGELSIAVHDSAELKKAVVGLLSADLNVMLPDLGYLRLMLQAVGSPHLRFISNCFGGRDLFFIQPNGSLWDCPSMYRIAVTPPNARRSIRDTSAGSVFSEAVRSRTTDCSCFSVDCVNMWQLMAFDEIITGVSA